MAGLMEAKPIKALLFTPSHMHGLSSNIKAASQVVVGAYK